ncbi:MAG: DUF6089 family protein [Bacteroidota bacterium]
MRIILRRVFIILFLSFLQVAVAFSQGIEFGLFLGGSNYYGDFSNDIIMLDQTHPSAGLIGRYNLSEKWAAKGFVGYGRISGDDKDGSTEFTKSRNLNFYSDIFEASAQLEYNLIKNSFRYTKTKSIVPYIFAGVGVFNFNPKTELLGEDIELMPLGTEGQGTTTYNDRQKYALTQFCIPFGIGFKKRLGNKISIGFEVGARYTYTNYLDDVGGTYADARVIERANGVQAALLSDRSWEVSPDGMPLFSDGVPRSVKAFKINDIYIMGGFTITYIFPNTGMRCPRF